MEYMTAIGLRDIKPENNSEITHTKEKRKLELMKQRLQSDIRSEMYKICIKIVNSPSIPIKMVLFLFVFAASSLAAYTVIESILTYFAFQVITTTRSEHETPTTFPKITLCNGYIFSTGYGLDLLKEANLKYYPNLDVMNETQMKNVNFLNKIGIIKNIHLAASGKVIDRNFSDENRKRLAHDLDDILLKCKYNYQPCTSADFLWTFDTYYGNCYIFNSGFNSTGQPVPLKKSSTAGSLFGLQLDMYVNFNESLKAFRWKGLGRGLLFRVDNSSYLTDHSVDGVKVAGGFQTDIVVNRAFKRSLPKPYSNCEIEESSPRKGVSEFYDLIAQSSYEYTQQLCFVQCYQKLTIQTCNCSAGIFVNLYGSSRLCESVQEVNCYLNVFAYDYLANDYINMNCMPSCPLECNSTEYTTSLSSIEFDGDLYVDYLQQSQNLSTDFANQPITATEASASIASINIFYDSLEYEYAEEIPQMDIVAMLGSIGGNLVLFLGMSILSVCELFEILIDILLIKFRKHEP